MKLIQIPFSHNCVKVRVALQVKGLDYEIENIRPMDRSPVFRASGQGLVPVLVDGERAVADSTAILLYLDEKKPDPPLLPKDPDRRAECLILEDWADRAFMEQARRIGYWNVSNRPGLIGQLFFPQDTGLKARIKEKIAKNRVWKRFRISAERYPRDLADVRRAAALAVEKLDGRPWLQAEGPTVADIALATMSAPLAADPALRAEPATAKLLAWGEKLLPPDIFASYRR